MIPVTPPGRLGIIHVHTAYSHDGRDTLPRLRDSCIARGIGFVGITDHAEDLTPDTFTRLLVECAELSDERCLLIPGLEYRFASYPGLHLLALGLGRWIDPQTPAEFAAQARAAARLIIMAHPRLASYRIPAEVVAAIDAIEVWNPVYDTRWLPDTRAMRLLSELRRDRPDLVGTAGIDQHDLRHDRQTRVLVRNAAADPLAEIRAGRFTNHGRTMRFDPHPDWPAWRLAMLSGARWALNGVEYVQERAFRAIAQWSGRNSGSART